MRIFSSAKCRAATCGSSLSVRVTNGSSFCGYFKLRVGFFPVQLGPVLDTSISRISGIITESLFESQIRRKKPFSVAYFEDGAVFLAIIVESI